MTQTSQTPPALELIGILTAPPWPAVPAPLLLVPCGRRGALFAPAVPATTPQEAARAALSRATHYERSGSPGLILPVAPGARVPPEAAAEVLERAEPEIARAIDETGRAAEYQLRVVWAEERVLDAFGGSPELAEVLGASRVRAAELALAVSRLADRLAAVMDAELARAGLPRVDQPRASGMLLHRSLLVSSAAIPALEAALERIDAIWPEGLTLRLVGPMPAVSFVLFEGVEVDRARRNAAWAVLGSAGIAGAAAVDAARRAALRRANGPATAAAIRAAARDLSSSHAGLDGVSWRLERRQTPALLSSAVLSGPATTAPVA